MHKRVLSRWISNETCEPPTLIEEALEEGFSGDVSWVHAHPPSLETLIELLLPEPREAKPNITH